MPSILELKKINQEDFLKEFNISSEKFAKSNLKWEDLKNIYSNYCLRQKLQLEQTAGYISNTLMKARKVHSVKFRIKDEKHLIEKIIRKKIENPKREINYENYLQEITDLMGIRAIHLFKEDWLQIHKFILKNWDLKEPPTAYVRSGDTDAYINQFKENGCEIKEHLYGYRSIHYIVKTSPGKTIFFAEIQVRTIFEEGWSEIDHKIRYPYEIDNAIYSQFLSILNRLAGSADEMGSFILNLQNTIDGMEWEYEEKIEGKNKLIKELEDKIQNLNIKEPVKKQITKNINEIFTTSNQQNASSWWFNTLASRPLAEMSLAEASKSIEPNKPKLPPVKIFNPSPALAEIIGNNALPRTEVVKKIWAYIKKNGLQDKKNKRMINIDEKLKAIFDGKSQVSMFDINKYLVKHLK